MYDPKRGYPTAVPYVLYRDPAAASRWVAEVTGFTGQPLYGPLPEGELRRNSLDIALAKEALAWHPWTHLEDGLKETVAFLRGI